MTWQRSPSNNQFGKGRLGVCEEALATYRLWLIFAPLLALTLSGCDFWVTCRTQVKRAETASMRVLPMSKAQDAEGKPIYGAKVQFWVEGREKAEEPDLTTYTGEEGLTKIGIFRVNWFGTREIYTKCQKKGYQTVEGTFRSWPVTEKKAVLIKMKPKESEETER
jgi:hypothetical protein